MISSGSRFLYLILSLERHFEANAKKPQWQLLGNPVEPTFGAMHKI
jgi:hypothetical protein